MLDSTDSEQVSVLLSKYLDNEILGTQEQVYIKKKAPALLEFLQYSPPYSFVYTGSFAEGMQVYGSDEDAMLIAENVAVMYPDQCITPDMENKTILFMRKADCRPGYVHVQLKRIGETSFTELFCPLVEIENSYFVSSDIFRENLVTYYSDLYGLKFESNGPSCTKTNPCGDRDNVFSFPCKAWPTEANEWITRPRLYGWPNQGLINSIVHNGCHLVPVGDKCSGNTLLQWRISFAKAEVSLVHSFSHIQLKVYCLLKYFLKQIKQTLRETIGDDDILCSYFLKTILFHAIENSNQLFWQEKNLFYCFWFCFNILLARVRAGVCPNYFIEANNLFERKVHGQHQRILFDVLNNYCQMKWKCLSVGNFVKPTIWEDLSNPSFRAFLARPKTAQEIVFRQDVLIAYFLQKNQPILYDEHQTRRAINLLLSSQTELDEVFAYNFTMNCIQMFAKTKVYPDHLVAVDNKTRYKSLRKCKRLMGPTASIGTDILYLATFHFLAGNFLKTLNMCNQTLKLACCYCKCPGLHSERRKIHRHEYHRSESATNRVHKLFVNKLVFYVTGFYLPHFYPEILGYCVIIPPLPYIMFLSFLCCHKLGHTSLRDEALRQLIKVQDDDDQGRHKYWMVSILLGICYQTIWDNHMAIKAYWESLQSKTKHHEFNRARERIAVVYLCMYASRRYMYDSG